jgi:hypothetical protein
MSFWVRHLFLLLVCIAAPFAAGFYFDTLSQVERARVAGGTSAQFASKNLRSRLTLEAHDTVSLALSLSQRLSDEQHLADLAKPGAKAKAAFAAIAQALSEGTPKGGMAWLVDADGLVIAENGQADPPEAQRSLLGHPMFVESQHGFALDGTFNFGGGLMLAAAAPISEKGVANGAIIVGRPMDREFIGSLQKDLGVELTLTQAGKVLASSLPDATAEELSGAAGLGSEPVLGGSLEAPLQATGYLTFLPQLIDRSATGLAYASVAESVPGIGDLRWVVSAPSIDGLNQIAARQELVLSVFAASFLFAMLVGLLNFRAFVSPIPKIEKHLSEIQLGSGHGELLESSVSRSFRRLVRLINMLVQKMPARSFSMVNAPDGSPISELPSALSPRRPDSLVGRVDALGGDAFGGQPASVNLSSFPSLPAQPAPPPPPSPGRPNGASITDDLFGGADDGGLQEAISSLEAGIGARPSPPPPSPPPPPPAVTNPAISASAASKKSMRSASEIRGSVPSFSAPPAPSGEMPSPFVPSQSQFLRAENAYVPDPVVSQGKPRGGGSLDFGGLGASAGLGAAKAPMVEDGGFNPEATVVAPVAEDLLAKSARDDFSDFANAFSEKTGPDSTLVAQVPADLLAASAGEGPPSPNLGADLDAADRAHFKEVYEKFIDMRRRCGEGTSDLAFEKFLTKLMRNRETLVKKYQCRTVRFQVYEKDGKAALKATPVRAK